MAVTHLVHGLRIGSYARDLAAGRVLRAPHHTCSEPGMLGELALAAGGVLCLDEFTEISPTVLGRLFWTWKAMPAEARPDIILALDDRDAADPRAVASLFRRLDRIARCLPAIDVHVHLNGGE